MGLLAIVFTGYFAAIVAPLLDRAVPRWTGWILAALAGIVTILVAIHAPGVWGGQPVTASFEWAGALDLALVFRLDGLSVLFALLIAAFGSIVLAYSGAYLPHGSGAGRLCSLLLLFMASMLGLALADNFLLLYVFWELTTISSYLLIGFEHDQAEARRAALQALLVTFGGGLALLAGVLILANITGTFSISASLALGAQVRAHPQYPAVLALIALGAFAKSAQFPFHFWLPDAMVAPTPVSAYLHSAAMVKAGVYLLARLAPVLGGTSAWFYTLVLTGGLTMLLGAVIGLRKTDMKQILAYATVSVLGLLVLLLGLDTPVAFQAMVTYFVAHALYKGGLFLVAGAVDHQAGTRDVMHLGGLGKAMPLTAAAALLAALSMGGVPLLLGFAGKEFAYEATIHAPHAGLITTAAAIAAALLLAQAARVGYTPFFTSRRQAEHTSEAPLAMWLGALLLASGGVVAGVAPSIVQTPVRSATRAMWQAPLPELPGFHALPQLTPVFLLSLCTLAAGILTFMLVRRSEPRPFSVPGIWSKAGPAHLFSESLRVLDRIAHAQTTLLQNGYLKYYLITVVGAAVVLLVASQARDPGAAQWAHADAVPVHEAIVVGAILAASLAAVRAGSPFASAAALGIVGYGIALVFAFFGAPDLAMTQLIVESLTVILLVLVFYHLPPFAKLTPPLARARDVTVAVAAGAVIATVALIVSRSHPLPAVAAFYLNTAKPLAHGRNVVNVILTDYRAMDTLGEVTVLAIAAVGVYSLLRLRMGNQEGE